MRLPTSIWPRFELPRQTGMRRKPKGKKETMIMTQTIEYPLLYSRPPFRRGTQNVMEDVLENNRVVLANEAAVRSVSRATRL